MLEMQERAAAGAHAQQAEMGDQSNPMLQNSNYMVVQNSGQNMPQFSQAPGPLGGIRQIKDSKKNEWQLAAEVNELKQQRNKDVDHIKILKVELQKLEQIFKKYKESLSPDSVPQV